MNDNTTTLIQQLSKELSCSAHDIEHVERVLKLARFIARDYDVDEKILFPAVLLHDIGRAKVDREKDSGKDHAMIGSDMSRKLLVELDYTPWEIDQICHCIESHRFRTKVEAMTIEAQILYDADKLDGLGATGIARSFIMVGQYGNKLYEDFDESERAERLIEKSTKHAPNIEFEIKYKSLPEKLYTPVARKIAHDRIRHMQLFFNQLRAEMEEIE